MNEDIVFNVISQPIAYEGAATSYRTGQRGLLVGDQDSLAAREVMNLIMRSEHACRNNGYAKTGLDKYVTSLGSVKVIWKDAAGKAHPVMQKLWDEFANNPNLDGCGTLDNTQSVWNASEFKTGNAFTRLHIRVTDNENTVPLKLQPISTILHDLGYGGKSTNEITRYGITFEDTKPVMYYFRKGIYEKFWYDISFDYPQVEIPANEILHIFDRKTPGQWIGVPTLSSILLPLYELDELTDATVSKQKAAQAIAWIVKNTNPVSPLATGTAFNTTDKDDKSKIVFQATGGNTQYLNKGEDIAFYQSTDIGANFGTLVKSELFRICATMGIPYHSITGDTSGLDFSAIRAIGIELRNRIEYIHHFKTIPLGLAPLTKEFKALAVLKNRLVSSAFPSYQLPRWYGVDDLKDVQADVLEVQNGMATLQSKLDERHTSMEDILADREKIKKAGIDSLLNPKQDKQANNTQANSNSTGN